MINHVLFFYFAIEQNGSNILLLCFFATFKLDFSNLKLSFAKFELSLFRAHSINF